MSDDTELVRRFEAGELPDGGFHHEQHVRVAWCYLRHFPLADALARFTAGLQRFACAQGAPGLYHETITVAYVLLINERLDRDRAEEWPAFAERNRDLLAWKPSILERYYLADTLALRRSRQTFVMPDRLMR